MSKHNYSQYSNNKKNDQTVDEKVEAVVEEEVTATVVEPAVEPEVTVVAEVEPEVVAPVVEPETVEGVVVNCAKLNVRVKPVAGADVVCVLDAASEIEIDIDKSTDEWFHVCTATGIEGYCMRKFVEANL